MLIWKDCWSPFKIKYHNNNKIHFLYPGINNDANENSTLWCPLPAVLYRWSPFQVWFLSKIICPQAAVQESHSRSHWRQGIPLLRMRKLLWVPLYLDRPQEKKAFTSEYAWAHATSTLMSFITNWMQAFTCLLSNFVIFVRCILVRGLLKLYDFALNFH